MQRRLWTIALVGMLAVPQALATEVGADDPLYEPITAVRFGLGLGVPVVSGHVDLTVERWFRPSVALGARAFTGQWGWGTYHMLQGGEALLALSPSPTDARLRVVAALGAGLAREKYSYCAPCTDFLCGCGTGSYVLDYRASATASVAFGVASRRSATALLARAQVTGMGGVAITANLQLGFALQRDEFGFQN